MPPDTITLPRDDTSGDPLDNPAMPVPSFVFNPADPWTAAFQAGLSRAGLRGRRIYEVGIGSGINVAFMLRDCAAAVVQGSDLDPRLPALARQFVSQIAPDLLDRFQPILGSVNLIDRPAAMAGVAAADVVVACLPQVPDPHDAMCTRFHLAHLRTAATSPRPREDDHMAHYYPWTPFHEYPYNAVGLGLIEALLRRVRRCAPNAQVILILGCRIGKDVLSQLFLANGYRPEELASRIVRQDERTDISFFAALEAVMAGTGYEQHFTCEFYADPQGWQPISAIEARQRLAADQPAVYHEICVLRGHPATAGHPEDADTVAPAAPAGHESEARR